MGFNLCTVRADDGCVGLGIGAAGVDEREGGSDGKPVGERGGGKSERAESEG